VDRHIPLADTFDRRHRSNAELEVFRAIAVGAQSYSLYLCHIPIWFVVMRHVGSVGETFVPLRFMIAALATLTAADLTYRGLELPLQERGCIRARGLDNVSDHVAVSA